MAFPLHSIFRLFLLLSFAFSSAPIGLGSAVGEEEFTEELLFKPLPDRKVLTHFLFQSRAPPSSSNGRHHHLFPKAISQLVRKYRVKEMEISFTQGRWDYELWGGFDPISSSNAKPPGVELWAVFDVPQDQVDALWKNLTHTLSGLFCASLNFLESSTAYSAPGWAFPPASGSLRYGTLPREAVCTENLTPWLKLLPCRDKAGLSELLDRPSIYRGSYHSQRLHLTSNEFAPEVAESGIVLEQTLTIVLQPSSKRSIITRSSEPQLQPSWSMSSIFGRAVNGKCVLAKSSTVYLQLESDLVTELAKVQKDNVDYAADTLALEDSWVNLGFELSVKPDKVFKEANSTDVKSSVLYEFLVEKYSNSEPLDLGLTWKSPLVWLSPQAPLRASRFLMGSGNERGTIAISLKSTEIREEFINGSDNQSQVQVVIFQVVPWYVKVYFHTVRVFVDEQPRAITKVLEKIRVSPSEDKVSPGVMEMVLKFPSNMISAALTLEFDKGFLHIDEYPPDANQGFDIPSAVISYPNFRASLDFLDDDLSYKSPMLSKFQVKSPVLSYSEVLLVPLTTPDFSMPYNVITITCTVFALYFGSLLNVLRMRVGAEERRLRKEAAAKKHGKLHQILSKLSAKLRGREWKPPSPSPRSSSTTSSSIIFKFLFKFTLVVGIAIGWQYYSGYG